MIKILLNLKFNSGYSDKCIGKKERGNEISLNLNRTRNEAIVSIDKTFSVFEFLKFHSRLAYLSIIIHIDKENIIIS